MKIAVTYENEEIFQHFGQTKEFKIYEVTDDKIISSQVIPTEGNGHGSIAGFLKTQKVDAVICGGIGGGAKEGLADAGIKLYGGVTGEADLAIDNLVKNTLVYNPEAECNHHDHEEHNHKEHKGGQHGTGEHNCGSHS